MRPTKFIRENDDHWILAEYIPSKPVYYKTGEKKGQKKLWEIRTSKNDESTYCSCPNWVTRLHSDGDKNCKHLLLFKAEQPTETIVMMNTDGYLRRGSAMVAAVPIVNHDVMVKRNS